MDAIGARHTPAPEARIVSLVPSLTELLFELGLGRQVVGRTGWCIHPSPEVRQVKALGGPKRINMRKFAALSPTHAVLNIDENPEEMSEEIARLGVRPVVTHPIAPEDNLALYRLFGGLFGREREAAALADRFAAALARLAEAAKTLPSRRVLYLIWMNPWMTVSADTYISRLLAAANWNTLGHDPSRRYPILEFDERLVAETDLILFATEPFPFQERHIADFVRRFPGAAGKAHLVRGDMLSWYGSRAIRGLDYLRELALALAVPAGLQAIPNVTNPAQRSATETDPAPRQGRAE
jgi:ABC-type Fe3+-hydroxamate transport system substrate-binding protein